MNNLYMLTDMTGKKSGTDRMVPVFNTEIRRRTLVLFLAGLVMGLIPQVFLIPMFGVWGLLLIPVCIGVLFFVFESRSKRGLQLRRIQTVADKLTDKTNGKIVLCGEEIESLSVFRRVVPSSTPVETFDTSIRSDAERREQAMVEFDFATLPFESTARTS